MPGDLIRASLASYARYWREAFRLPSMDHRVLARELDEAAVGGEHVAAALDAGRGAILALPHSGNWDMAGVWLTNTHGRFATVAERLKPESLYKRFLDYRESLGFEVLPLTGGARPPFEILGRAAPRQRAGVPDVRPRPDQVAACGVDLFGEPTRLPAGPAKLAMATGAALLPVHSYYEPDVAVTAIGAPLDTSSGDVGPSRRRWPTSSPPTSPPTPPTGTCCSRSGSPTCRRSAAAPARADPAAVLMRIGMVCPYSFDVPGGVQAHVLQLAEVMRGYGHRRERAGAVVAGRPSCPTTSSPAARPSPFRTTGRSRGCGSAPPPTAR